jgi:hypothetical protein
VVSVFLVKEDDGVVSFVDGGLVGDVFGDEDAVAFLVGVRGSVHGEVDGSVDDEFPLAVVGVFWDVLGLGEFHEDDLFVWSLDEVAVDVWVGELYLWEFLDGWWEEGGHGVYLRVWFDQFLVGLKD